MRSTCLAPLGTTDLLSWRLDSSDAGRHVWHYASAQSYPALWGPDDNSVRSISQSPETKYALGLPLDAVAPLANPAGAPLAAARNGKRFPSDLIGRS